VTVEEHNLSRKQGDGARSEIEDEKMGDKWETKDERADTHTTFYESDINNCIASQRRKRRLRRILKLQEGQQVNADGLDSRGQQNHKEDKRRMVSSFGSQLELTPAQKKRVKHLIMDVMSVNSFGSYSSEQVVLATINVVAREDERWIEDEDQFQQFMQYVEITKDDGSADLITMRRLRALVRDRIPSIDN
jgi:hypothetical protein